MKKKTNKVAFTLSPVSEYFNRVIAEGIVREINSISMAELITWKLKPTLSFDDNMNVVYEFDEKDLKKIKRKKPNWNGLVTHPNMGRGLL